MGVRNEMVIDQPILFHRPNIKSKEWEDDGHHPNTPKYHGEHTGIKAGLALTRGINSAAARALQTKGPLQIHTPYM
jgi:hypothetical protein